MSCQGARIRGQKFCHSKGGASELHLRHTTPQGLRGRARLPSSMCCEAGSKTWCVRACVFTSVSSATFVACDFCTGAPFYRGFACMHSPLEVAHSPTQNLNLRHTQSGGQLWVNGAETRITKFKKLVGVVPQDDVMHRDLTGTVRLPCTPTVQMHSCPLCWRACLRSSRMQGASECVLVHPQSS